MAIAIIFGCKLPQGRDPALSVTPGPGLISEIWTPMYMYITHVTNGWPCLSAYLWGLRRWRFPHPALICLHVVIEIVLTFYGMSFKGPHSLHSMMQPICMVLLWIRPSGIVKRALDGKTEDVGSATRWLWGRFGLLQRSPHWQISVNSGILLGPSVHPCPSYLKPREFVKS